MHSDSLEILVIIRSSSYGFWNGYVYSTSSLTDCANFGGIQETNLITKEKKFLAFFFRQCQLPRQ